MGLEPTTSAVTGRHSNQLNHRANVSMSDSYIYYHTFCVLARGFLKKILEKVFQRQLIHLTAFVMRQLLHKNKLLGQLVILQGLTQQLNQLLFSVFTRRPHKSNKHIGIVHMTADDCSLLNAFQFR